MVQIGIIGAGRIGKVHLQSLRGYVTGASVKTVADPVMSDETAAWLRGMDVPNITRDYRDILNDPEIDAVLVCSSTDTHAQIALEAIAAGKHVFCEKPVDHDTAKIQAVSAALQGTDLKFQVGFNRRFDHNFKAVHQAVVSGQIGDVHIVKITSRDPEPPNPVYIHSSGGMFMDMTIHDFDMVRYLSGSEVDEIYVAAAVLVDPAIGQQGDVDTAVITMKMKNGVLAVIDNSRKAVYGYDQRAEVFGSGGMVATGNDTQSSAVLSTEAGIVGEKPLYFFLERYMQSFADEMQQFITAVETGQPVPVGIDDGLQPVLIAEAALKSLRENRPVKVETCQS